MVGAEVDICPNCSHPFPEEDAAIAPKGTGLEIKSITPKPAISRPFKFIILFLLSFIAVLGFISAEGMTLNGSTNASYLFGDVIFVSLVSALLAVAFMFIDYMVSE